MTAATPPADPAAHHDDDTAVGLSEVRTVALAALVWLGAVVAWPVPVAPAAAGAVLAVVGRRPLLALVAVPLLASALGHRAEVAHRPVEPGPFDGRVTLVTDPEPIGPVGGRAIVRLDDGRRVELAAYGEPAFALDRATVGDRFLASGRLRAIDDGPWNRSRHLLGRLAAAELTPADPPALHWRLVAAVRNRIAAGAERLPAGDRPLYLGLVVGDDRHQGAARQAAFRAAGLTHLLAVSGQNVAFVLAVAGPAVRSLGRSWRPVAVIAVLVLFALVTRLEPSVLRATTTAGLATVAAAGGHRQSGVRLLALAVTGLVLVDPFLTVSVGFQLSVAASGGILVLAPVLAGRWRLPRFVAEPLAVTVAAQVGVLPLLLAYFGPVSAASVPANLLAGWAAGAVMTWGLTVGVVAGLAPAAVGEVLQAPAHLLLWWLDAVARWACLLPTPAVDGRLLVTLGGLVLVGWAGRGVLGRRWPTVCRALAVAVAAAGAAAVVAAVPVGPSEPTELPGGGRWLPPVHGRPGVLVVAADADDDLLTALLTSRIGSVDVVVSQSGRGRGAETAAAVAELVAVGTLLAPPRHRIVGAVRVVDPVVVHTGHGTVLIEGPADRDDDRLVVSAS